MSQSILFHIDSDGSLSEMKPRDYDDEDHIQRLLAEYPAILGAQYNFQEPRRWALVQREVPVPDGVSSDRRWSLDHLYVDQDAIPTLVEVKRNRDTRSRREVIGQMFDYAANGPAYWSMGALRDAFASTHASLSPNANEALQMVLGEDVDCERFWTEVEENLRAGRIRMIFLVDQMPDELLRIVEFLAKQLRTAEVYAVEVRQHVGASGQVLATSILGQTQNDEKKISAGRTMTRLTIDEWFIDYQDRHGDKASEIARFIQDWAEKLSLSAFVTSAQTPSLGWTVTEGETSRYPLFLTGNGKVSVSLSYLAYSPLYQNEADRQALVDALRSIDVPFSLRSLNGDIRIPISELQDPTRRDLYLEIIKGVVARFRGQ